jgi:N,N'-diacetyllegionaminate synthase
MNKQLEIIAEMGQGFEGSLNLGMMLSRSASNTTADAVKFQMVFADELAVKNYLHYPLFKSLELKFSEWNKIVSFLKKKDKKIYFDVFGKKSLKYSEELKADGIKIHPTDILNFDFLDIVKKSNIKKILLGIGGIKLEAIDKVVKFFDGKKNIILLNGFQAYPTKIKENNLNNISVLKNKYHEKKSISYGFADHEASNLNNTLMLSTLAIGVGANYIEKHFTLTETLKMEDYESALSPKDFDKYARNLKIIFKSKNSLGLKKYKLSLNEKRYHETIIRQVIAKKNLKKNKLIKISDLVLKRSDERKALNNLSQCVGKKTKFNIKAGQAIKKSLIF